MMAGGNEEDAARTKSEVDDAESITIVHAAMEKVIHSQDSLLFPAKAKSLV